MKRDFDNYYDTLPTQIKNSRKEYSADKDGITAEQQAIYEAQLRKKASAGRVIAIIFAVLNGIAAAVGLLTGNIIMFFLEGVGVGVVLSRTAAARWIFLAVNLFAAIFSLPEGGDKDWLLIFTLYNVISAVAVIFEKHLDAYFKTVRSYKNK